jgi:toxin ParE1/3/4
MEIRKKEVRRSTFYLDDIQDVFEYGEATFGLNAALYFFEDLKLIVRRLELEYHLHPECRHLETKSKKYRNIILGSYLIIYRITETRIEVLRAFHGSRSPRTIKNSRSIKIS